MAKVLFHISLSSIYVEKTEEHISSTSPFSQYFTQAAFFTDLRQ